MRGTIAAALCVLTFAGAARAQVNVRSPFTGSPYPSPYGPVNDGYPHGSSYVTPGFYTYAARQPRPVYRYAAPAAPRYYYVPRAPARNVHVPPAPVQTYYYVPAPTRRRRIINARPNVPYSMPPMGFPPAGVGIPRGMNFPPPMM